MGSWAVGRVGGAPGVWQIEGTALEITEDSTTRGALTVQMSLAAAPQRGKHLPAAARPQRVHDTRQWLGQLPWFLGNKNE